MAQLVVLMAESRHHGHLRKKDPGYKEDERGTGSGSSSCVHKEDS